MYGEQERQKREDFPIKEIKKKKKKTRYYFVYAIFNILENGVTSSGSCNFGIATNGLNNEYLRESIKRTNENVIIDSIVIQNFIEMSKEDYLIFWNKAEYK